MRFSIGLLVVLVAGPVFAEPPASSLSKRMDEEIVRRRRELDQLEQRWSESTTCLCETRDVDFEVPELARKWGVRPVLFVQLKGDGAPPMRSLRYDAVRLESPWKGLLGFLDDLTSLKVSTRVRDLRLRARGSPLLEVSFSLTVSDDVSPGQAIDEIIKHRWGAAERRETTAVAANRPARPPVW
jgi:hypothetical protein